MTDNERRARLEDIAWMVESGENAEGAARRMGLTATALEKWARIHAPDMWAALVARNPLPIDSLQAHKLMMQRGRVRA
jgi:hypothetical protein